MHNHSKIMVGGACNFQKIPKTGFWNVGDVYSKSCKHKTKGDRDLKYGLK